MAAEIEVIEAPRFRVRVHRVGHIVGYRMGSIFRCKGCLPQGPGWESVADSPAVDGVWCSLCGSGLEP